MDDMHVLAIDVGTSSARASVFDAAGRPLPDRRGQVQYEPRTTPDGGVELDADLLLDAVVQAIDRCLADAPPVIDAVGISAFWHGLLALDANMRPLTPVLTWADTRAASAAAELRDALDEDAVRGRVGAALHASYFPAKLRWLHAAEPSALARARRIAGF